MNWIPHKFVISNQQDKLPHSLRFTLIIEQYLLICYDLFWECGCDGTPNNSPLKFCYCLTSKKLSNIWKYIEELHNFYQTRYKHYFEHKKWERCFFSSKPPRELVYFHMSDTNTKSISWLFNSKCFNHGFSDPVDFTT